MAITVPQFPVPPALATTQTPAQTFAGAVGAGNTIIALVGWGAASGTVTSVQDSVNGAVNYTLAGSLIAGSGRSLACYYFTGSAAGTPTVTATLSASQASAGISCFEANFGGTPVTDQFHSAQTSGSATTSSGNVITIYPNELLIGGVRGSLNANSGTAGWTFQGTGGFGAEYEIVSAVSIYAATFTINGSGNAITGIWTFAAPGQAPVAFGGVGSLVGAYNFFGGGFN
jgi:hypothetical protein